ncbi:fec operon regulator FecR [compost metagenome]
MILRGGEIEVSTGHGPAARPFTLATRHGLLTPLGTRFIVRDVPGDNPHTADHTASDTPDSIAVAVLEGAVRITPRLGQRSVRVNAGQSSRFTATDAAAPVAMAPAESAWLDGMLVADHTPLPRLLAELGRYRRGLLRCDPALASLDVSGAFPLADTGAVLALLEEALPVRIRSVTRYWVTVAPR